MSTLTNLLAYWRMDETTGNRLDSVGGLDLVPSGTVGKVTGKIGDGAAEITSATSYLSASGTLPADFSGNGYTLAGWVRIDTSSGSATSEVFNFAVNNGASSYRSLTLDYNHNTNQFELYTLNNDTSADDRFAASTFGTITVGTWYHIVITRKNTNASLFVNNTEDSSGGAASFFGYDTINQLEFGLDASSTHEFSLDDWGIWDEEISATDRSDLYNSGSGAIPPGLGTPESSAAGAPLFAFHGR